MMVDELISCLRNFAKEDFPVYKVSNYLNNLPLNDVSLNDYAFLRKISTLEI